MQAERHVAAGGRILKNQRWLVEHLRRNLCDRRLLVLAETLLLTFEEAQTLSVANAARLRRELEMLTHGEGEGAPDEP